LNSKYVTYLLSGTGNWKPLRLCKP